jgi:hypothetical protein
MKHEFEPLISDCPNTEEDKAKYTGRWEVNLIGGPLDDAGEVSIIRKDFEHGKESYGWPGPMKIILSDSDTFSREENKYAKLVWKETVEFAARLAKKLNEIEGRK